MWTLAEIAEHIGGIVHGDEKHQVASVATLQLAQKDQLSFLSNRKYTKYLTATNAGVVIVHHDKVADAPCHSIAVDNPYIAYAKAATLLNPTNAFTHGIHISASVDSSSSIAESASIAANVVIGANVTIGKGVVIGPSCVILDGVKIAENTRLIANITLCESVQIGHDVLIHPGAVIGSDGFGIANDHGQWIKVPQLGSVRVGHYAEIGANTTIDCGAIEDTVIGNGVKIDNQVQIAHNVIIGDNTVIAGCVGIAGSTQIGQNCAFGGGVAISGHLQICDGVQLTGMTMVTKSISEPGVYSSGIPAESTERWHRNVVRYRQMEKLISRVKALELKNK